MRMRRQMRVLLCALAVLCAVQPSRADKTHSQTSKANRLYNRERYEEALQIYDQALLEAPNEHKLHANRGSALYKLNRLDEADTAYQRGLQVKDRSALADIHYNRGNALFRQGEALMQSGGPAAMEKFKAALSEYIQALDLRSNDKDAKWNLQLAHNRIQQLQQQQSRQQNQNQKNSQDPERRQDQQSRQDQQNKQEQPGQDQQPDRRDQQQDSRQDQNNENKPQPQPQPQQNRQEDVKKAEAARLIRQFADDDKNLNKPHQVRRAGETVLEKDW